MNLYQFLKQLDENNFNKKDYKSINLLINKYEANKTPTSIELVKLLQSFKNNHKTDLMKLLSFDDFNEFINSPDSTLKSVFLKELLPINENKNYHKNDETSQGIASSLYLLATTDYKKFDLFFDVFFIEIVSFLYKDSGIEKKEQLVQNKTKNSEETYFSIIKDNINLFLPYQQRELSVFLILQDKKRLEKNLLNTHHNNKANINKI